MESSQTHSTLFALGEEDSRARAACQLAEQLCVEDALLYAVDPSSGILIPALGMPQTVRGGRTWRVFLASLTKDGRHEGLVDLPQPQLRRAYAVVNNGTALVLLGGSPEATVLAEVERLLPLLSLALKAEQRLMAAKAAAFAAAGVATRANALALALERARSDASTLNAQLRAEDLAKDEFLATLAHELRNPISGIRVSVSALQNVHVEDAARERLLKAVDRQSKQLASLVDDLLDAARIRHGRVALQIRSVDLREVLADAIELNRHLATAKSHTVEVDLGDESIYAEADPTRLLQIFTNLFVNACKYTNVGGRIAIILHHTDGWAEARIEDSGIGIELKMLPTIFELFTQEPTAIKQAQGGLGIGLSLVKRLVDLHGGRISASSPGLGLGSTFAVRLPLAEMHT